MVIKAKQNERAKKPKHRRKMATRDQERMEAIQILKKRMNNIRAAD
jgi:hypothetical protein